MIVYPVGHSGQTLVFTAEVLATFAEYRQRRWWQREAGGQLFARFNGKSVVVVEATVPGRADFRTRHSFRPDRGREQREIVRYHKRGLHFIGDWHSHPEPVPHISPIDAESLRDMVRRSTHELNGFVMVIVGTGDAPAGLSVSVSDGSTLVSLASRQQA
jgi:integrative and conjugative element protein (TIGR02256 family)